MIDIKVGVSLLPTVIHKPTPGLVVDRQVDRQGSGDNDNINALREFVNFTLDQWGSSYYADDEDVERLLSAMRNCDDIVTSNDIFMLVNLGLEKLRISYDAGDEAEKVKALISAIQLCAPGTKRPCKVHEERVRPDWVATEVERSESFPKGKRLAALRKSNPKLGRLIVEIRSWVREKRFMPYRVATEFRRETHDLKTYKTKTFCGLPIIPKGKGPRGAKRKSTYNFQRGYTVVDRHPMRMLRDPYTAKPFVVFYAYRRVGGDVMNFEARKLLKFATS